MEEENKNYNNRFYILYIILLILSFIISYFNYKMNTVIPNLKNATYGKVLEHTKLFKKSKKYLKK